MQDHDAKPASLPITRLPFGAVAVGLSYLIAGLLSLQLAVAPGYAAPFWPASGIALAAAILFGNRILPAIFVASALLNLGIGYMNARELSGAVTLSAVLIGAGAAGQAWLGSWLASRVIGARLRFQSAREVTRFLVLTGPVACTVNACIGPLSLMLLGLITPAEIGFTQWNWWIGDVIGVCLVAPLAIVWFGRAGRRWRRKRIQIAVPVVIAAALVITMFYSASQREMKRIDAQFDQLAAALASTVEQSLYGVEALLTSLQGLYDSSDVVTREEFRMFSRRLLAYHDEIRAVSFNVYFHDADRPAFEALLAGRNSGSPPIVERGVGGELVAAKQAEEYVVVRYVEPLAGNETAIGYNVMSEETRREAIQRALATGHSSATGPLQLLQDGATEPGMLVFAPVTGSGGISSGGNPDGFVVAIVKVPALLEHALADLETEHIGFALTDLATPERPMFTVGLTQSPDARRLSYRHVIEFAGRQWQVDLWASGGYVAAHRSFVLWPLLAGGLLLSAMLGAFLIVLTGHTFRERGRVAELHRVNRRLEDALVNTQLMESELKTEKARAKATLNAIGDGVITIDGSGLIDYVNPVAETLTGWLAEDALGRPLEHVFVLCVEGDDQAVSNPAAVCIEHSQVETELGQLSLTDRNGRKFAIRQSVRALSPVDAGRRGYVIAFQDVTAARQVLNDMRHQATHDTLTGQVNRREFLSRLERSLGSAQQHGMTHSLCFMDLDFFKAVNDTAGHDAGDQLLVDICAIVSDNIRQRDTLARLGGDEFALLLEHCPLSRAESICEDIIAAVSAYRLNWEGHQLQVGMSIGVVAISEKTQRADEAMRRADEGCYRAKALGRNRVHVAGEKGITHLRAS